MKWFLDRHGLAVGFAAAGFAAGAALAVIPIRWTVGGFGHVGPLALFVLRPMRANQMRRSRILAMPRVEGPQSRTSL